VYVMETEISLGRDILLFWRTILELGDNTFLHHDTTWEDAVGYAAWYDQEDRAINVQRKTMELVDALTVRTRLTVTYDVIVKYNTPRKFVQYIKSNHSYTHYETYDHANVIIYDDVLRTMELFEPHTMNCSDMCACRETRLLLQTEIVPIFTNILGYGVELVPVCKHDIQGAIEEISLRKGSCAYASAIYAHCRILNPNLSPDRVGEILLLLCRTHWSAVKLLRSYLHVTNGGSLKSVRAVTLPQIIEESFVSDDSRSDSQFRRQEQIIINSN
jgi:hypothetical protein